MPKRKQAINPDRLVDGIKDAIDELHDIKSKKTQRYAAQEIADYLFLYFNVVAK